MNNIKKYLPYVLAAAALIGLYLQYRQYQMAKGDCGCGDEGASAIGPID